MQKARGNHCIKKILTDIQVSVVHENCCKPILTIENNKRERERGEHTASNEKVISE
jgi:hypothetical protein